MFRSIRHGLFAALAGFTVLLCVGYTGLALLISYVTEDMLVDRLLQREAAAVTARYQLRGDIQATGDDLIRVYRDAAALPPIVRAQVAAGRERGEIFTDTGQHYHLRVLDLGAQAGPRRLYLLADVGPLLVVSKLFQDVGGVLVAVALGLIALALLLAYLLSRRLVLPLQVLADEVKSLQPEAPIHFSARRRPDEIGYLADKLGTTLAALHAALHREQAFTRDVGHELRTPLTVMNNVLGQAASRPLQAHELAQLRAGLGELGATVDVLFALARAEHIPNATVDLRGCIEDSLLRLLEQSDWDDDRVALRLPDRLEVTGNRHLSMLLLNNCLGNALFHGGAGCRLRLSFADGVLSLANTVDPARAGAMQGFLHGQHLLRRIAKAMDWEIAFHAEAAAYRVDIVPILPPVPPRRR
ncbi:Signal transduction histidine kinase [Duganella sp. CF517]|uniref:sensor histidine kinase n=1 Tax=Duganella sp. CF517 TaxID=1881038 RepID=UPI0008D7F4A0|nr:HAMP domain-containing protein [Duganella sp. CF517]SEN65353.1 Signal transduction histidine kinase [Duganella sp. CF517]